MGLKENLEKASQEAIDETNAECSGDTTKTVSKRTPDQNNQSVDTETDK